jgi:hypothetical protein
MNMEVAASEAEAAATQAEAAVLEAEAEAAEMEGWMNSVKSRHIVRVEGNK